MTQDVKFCPHCGNNLSLGELICPACGKDIQKYEIGGSPEPQPAAPTTFEPVNNGSAQQGHPTSGYPTTTEQGQQKQIPQSTKTALYIFSCCCFGGLIGVLCLWIGFTVAESDREQNQKTLIYVLLVIGFLIFQGGAYWLIFTFYGGFF